MALLPFLTIDLTGPRVSVTTSRDTSHLSTTTERRFRSFTPKKVQKPVPFDPVPIQIKPKLKGNGLPPQRGGYSRSTISSPARRSLVVELSRAYARAPGASKQFGSTPSAATIKPEQSSFPEVSAHGCLIICLRAPSTARHRLVFLNLVGCEDDRQLFHALRSTYKHLRGWTRFVTSLQAIEYVQVSSHLSTYPL
jgi:hypothetical protein